MDKENMFASTEISDLCDSIKNIHEILKTVGVFFSELSMNDENGNGLLIDFKKWGIKTITKEMLNKQLKTIDRIKEIYDEEKKKLQVVKNVLSLLICFNLGSGQARPFNTLIILLFSTDTLSKLLEGAFKYQNKPSKTYDFYEGTEVRTMMKIFYI